MGLNGRERTLLIAMLAGLFLSGLWGCASTRPLPSWVLDVRPHEGYDRAVGFGQGQRIPDAFREARRNALMQIVESSFGESVRSGYRKEFRRVQLVRTASVVDFFQSATSGSLFGQRVVHNEVDRSGKGYVAYVLVEVSKKDLEAAYGKFLEQRKERKELLLAETRGAILLETRHYRKALDYYRGMVRKDPGSDVWWIGVGAALYRLGDYRGALEATDKGLLRNPLSFYGYWNRSSILHQLGNERGALESLQQACRIRPSGSCSRRLEKERQYLR